VTEGRTCLAPGCGKDISRLKASAKTCSPVCKKRWQRTGSPPREPSTVTALDSVPDIAVTKARQAVVDLECSEIKRERERLELARVQGEVVPVRELEDEFGRFTASVRAQLLAVIGDIRQELSGLTREEVAKVDAIVRRRLDLTADAIEAEKL
jgi:hypothetical protein